MHIYIYGIYCTHIIHITVATFRNQMTISLPLVAQEARDSDSEAVDLSDEAWDGGPSEISMGFFKKI